MADLSRMFIINVDFVMKFGKNKIKVEKNGSFGYNNGSFHTKIGRVKNVQQSICLDCYIEIM